MPWSVPTLIRAKEEYCSKDEIEEKIPRHRRGLYVLYQYSRKAGKYNVVYIGMATAVRGGIRRRLMAHRRKKGEFWTHFSAFEVWGNISDAQIAELEGLLRQIYMKDARANRLNIQRGCRMLRRIPGMQSP